ncbi:hypothetical protein [Aerosakkonema funiforme]
MAAMVMPRKTSSEVKRMGGKSQKSKVKSQNKKSIGAGEITIVD